jgi:hypothetical protein
MHDCHANRVIFGLNQLQQFRQGLLWAYAAYGVLGFGFGAGFIRPFSAAEFDGNQK